MKYGVYCNDKQVVHFRKNEIDFTDPIFPREFEKQGYTTSYKCYGIASGTYEMGVIPKNKEGRVHLLGTLADYVEEKYGCNISLSLMREKVSHLIVEIAKLEQSVLYKELHILYISDFTINALCKKINENK